MRTIATPMLLGVLLVTSIASASEVGRTRGGVPRDRLDHPGTPTDRYLDAEEVRAVLHGATEQFYSCFRTHVRGGAEVGEVGVTFLLPRTGKATEVVAELDRAPEVLGPCLAGVVEGLEFGDHDGDPLPISYPLVYQADRKGARVLPYPIVFSRPAPVRLPLLALPLDVSGAELRMLEYILVLDSPPPIPQTSAAEDEAGDSGAANPEN